MSPAIDPEPTFSTAQAARLCRVSVRQLQWWRDQRLLRPRMERHSCRYSAQDLRMVRILRDLMDKELKAAVIRRWLPKIAASRSTYLLIEANRRRARFARDDQHALELAAKASHGVFLVDLRRVSQ